MREELESASNEVFDFLLAGWSESIYQKALMHELSQRGVTFTTEGTIPVFCKGSPVGRRRPDLFVKDNRDKTIIVELKAGSNSGRAQLLQYLRMVEMDHNFPNVRGGALIRFNDVVEFEFVELGPEINPDDKQTTLGAIEE